MRRIPRTPPLLLALLLLAATAHAGQGVNIRWSTCLGDGGTLNRNFACNTNAGEDRLVCSFQLAAALDSVSGQEFLIDIFTYSASLPAWWFFKNPGACRQTSIVMATAGFGTEVNCAVWASSPPLGVVSAYTTGLFGPSSARLRASVSVPDDALASLSAGTEYWSAAFRIDHQKTIGAGACAGCSVPACIVFTVLNVTTAGAAHNRILSGPSNGTDSNFVTWQGGGTYFNYPCPYPVPTRRSSWGAVKALYH